MPLVFLQELQFVFSVNVMGGRSAVRQPSDFSPAMDEQKTIFQDGALFSPHPFSAKNHKTTIIPLEVLEDFFGEADVEKQRSFRGCFPHIHTPSKTTEIVAEMIGKFRKTACHFAPDAPCSGTS